MPSRDNRRQKDEPEKNEGRPLAIGALQAGQAAQARFFLASIVESSLDSIVTIDFDGIITSWNKAAEVLYGYPADEALGQPLTMLTLPEDLQQILGYIDKVQHSRKVEIFDTVRVHKGGREIHLEIVMSPVKDDTGRIIGVSTVARDVTERRRSEVVLRQSEEQFRRAIEEASIPIIMQAEDGEVLQISRTWTELTGYTMEDVPNADAWLSRAYGEGADAVRAHMQELFEGPQRSLNVEFTIRTRHKADRCWSFSASSPGALGDGRRYIVGMALDITERIGAEAVLRASEARQAFLVRLGDELQPLTDAVAIQATAARMLGEHLGSERAYYVEIDERNREFVVAHDWHQPGVPSHARRYPLEDWTMPWLANGKTWVIRDIDTDPIVPDNQRTAYRGNNIRAAVVVPLVKGGRLVATFAVNQNAPREWTAEEVAFVEETAERTWAALARARSEETLREREEQFRRAIEEAPIPVILHAEDGEVLQISRTWTELTGYTLQDIPTIDAWLGHTSGADTDAMRAHMQELFTSKQNRLNIEFTVHTRNEADRYWSFSASSPGVLRDGRHFVVSMATDITERKRREANLTFLAEISEDFSQFRKLDELVQQVGNKIGAFLKIQYCHFVLIDEARDEVSYLYGWNAPSVRPVPSSLKLSAHVNPDFLKLVQTRHTVVSTDTANDSRMKGEENAKVGAGALVTVPIHRSGDWKYLFAVHDANPRQWRDDEIELVQELANRLFPRLERARTEEDLRQSNEQFRLFTSAVSDSLYKMSADWSELRSNQGMEFLADTTNPDHNWLDEYIPESDKTLVRSTIEAAIREKQVFELEHRVIRADGTIGWTFSRAIPLLDESGEIIEWFGVASDITERKRAETALRENEQRLAGIFANASVGLCEISLVGRLLRVNDELCKLLGRSRQQLLELSVADVTHPEDIADCFAAVREVIESGQPISIEKRYMTRDGLYIFARSSLTLLTDEHGQPDSILAVMVDYTARKLAEDRLRESEERYRLLVEGTRDYAMFLTDAQRRIVHWNTGAERVFGWTREEAIGQSSDMIFVPEECAAGVPEEEAQIAVQEGRAPDIRWHLRKDGSLFWADGVNTCLKDENGNGRGFVKITRDATREKQADEALRQAHDELEQRVRERTAELQAEILQRHESDRAREQLLQRVVSAQEEERRRISLEMHDQMGQQLTALLLGLKVLSEAPNSREQVERLSKLGRDIMDQMHHLARALRPAVLDTMGLQSALKEYVEEWSQQSGVTADLIVSRLSPSARLRPELETAIYRVVQEALTNVQRHAKASTVSVLLKRQGNTISAIIEDDGQGFEVSLDEYGRPRQVANRLGILGMQERLDLVGGSLTIESSPGAGTAIYVSVPIERRSAPRGDSNSNVA